MYQKISETDGTELNKISVTVQTEAAPAADSLQKQEVCVLPKGLGLNCCTKYYKYNCKKQKKACIYYPKYVMIIVVSS